MAHADQAMQDELRPQERHQIVERAVVTERDALAPCLFADARSRAVLGGESGRRVQTFCLPSRDQLELGTNRHRWGIGSRWSEK